MNCDPNNLSKLSSCMRCLSDFQLLSARSFLICRWFNALSGGTPNAPTNPDIASTSVSNNITVTWTNPTPAGMTNEIWRSTDGSGAVFSLFATVAGNVTSVFDNSALPGNTIWYYKIRSCNGSSCSAFTSMVGIVEDFTSANVASINLPFLVQSSGNFQAAGLALLTSVSLPKLHTAIGNLDISNNPNLTSISVPALNAVGLSMTFGSNKLTGAFSTPALVTVGGDIQLQSNTLMTSWSSPLLVSVGSILAVSGCTSLTSVTLTNLQSVTGGRTDFSGDTALTSLSLPAFTTAIEIDFNGNTSMTSVSLPLLNSINAVNIFSVSGSGCTLLTSFSIPSLTAMADGFQFDLSLCALNAASINQVLARGVATGVVATDFELAGGTNAAPSGQGVADKATLIGLGNTVNTN